MRHPTRVLFILLLLLLVIASRFLYSSVPEQQHVHELNLLAGGLSQQHGYKNVRKLGLNPQAIESRTALHVKKLDINTLEQRKDVEIQNLRKEKDKEKDLSKKARERIDNNSKARVLISEGSDEETENDLNRHKIPDKDRIHENAGKLSPFEVAEKDKEIAARKITREKEMPNDEAGLHDSFSAKNKENLKRSREKNLHVKHSFSEQDNNILMVLAKVGQTSPLAKRFRRCVLSVCEHSTVNLTFHIITDNLGKLTSEDTFNEARKVCKSGLNVTYYDVGEVAEKVRPITKEIQHFFRSGDPNSYYSDPLFFLSTSIHLVLPQNKMHVILLDSDLFFQADIKQLFAQFDKFKSTNIFGLAREQQPVYRHVLHMFRDRHPGTKVGGPPPDGLTGFNSGVVLINLHNMRSSKLYNKLLRGSIVKEIASKYTFQGHLGDQDFYSLLNLDYPELFHVLPCSWNRQLCTWWRDKGYAEVFDSYFNCSEPIHVYHGNCGTKMPNE